MSMCVRVCCVMLMATGNTCKGFPVSSLHRKRLREIAQAELERVRAENKQLEEDFNAVLIGLKVCPEVVEGTAARLSAEGTAGSRLASV